MAPMRRLPRGHLVAAYEWRMATAEYPSLLAIRLTLGQRHTCRDFGATERLLLRCLSHRGATRAELVEQRRLLGLGGGEMARLDVAVAADFLRNAGQSHREVMILRRQRRQNLLQHRLIIGNELALGAALGRVAERIEPGAAQEFEARERAVGRHHPRAE